ncbi:hypothetical protein [Dehalogenimonas etheniformans]|uniref:Uncharacterized protein n=1 Tax=Dehalogenimonas etheniformans TaxID=1536648 RepID=A0A2P5P5B5_9CHLR|nr:hypothetical protein [Dehalogenimonas etheniformans]PPD57484.1 hypothetical protein JP09_009145 [Dehalogenimonas etheniformans]QNT76847.1 hypothetical protein HX448_09240 [Dehalogenimonas etheniformans]
MIGDEVFHVAAMPPAELSSELITRIANAVAQPDYQIRFQFAGRLPRMIGHFRNEDAAIAATRSLSALGLTAFVVSESELRQPVSPKLVAHSASSENDRTSFSSRNGNTESLTGSDVFMILAARRTSVVEEGTSEKTMMKVNVPATLLSGGIPLMKRIVSKGREAQTITEQFIRLYGEKSIAPAIEICQFDFDYSFLGGRMGPTAAGNFSTLVDVLRKSFPKAYFNDSMLTGFAAGSDGDSRIDIVEQNCLLLVRYYQAMAKNHVREAA